MGKQGTHNCRKIIVRIQKYFWNKQVIKSEWATATEEMRVKYSLNGGWEAETFI